MKKNVLKLSLVIIVFFGFDVLFTNCKKDKDPTVSSPQIDSFSPTSGTIGTTVIVTGKNFSNVVGENEVSFNGTAATVTAASSTSLTVTVPSGASSGKVSVVVKGVAAVSATDFTILPPLPVSITSFTPSSGIAGTTVTIAGDNFSTTPSDNVVKFNGVLASLTAATSTTLTTTVPLGATTGKISITTNGVTVTSATDFTVPLPIITTLSPAYALPGATVIISGNNFMASSLTSNNVKFNGTDAIVTAASATQLSVTVPAAATTGKITVSVGGQTTASSNDFEVILDIPRDGLVAFYPFSGNANDVSGNSLNGTANGNAALSTDRYGNANKSYSFDGTNSYIDMGNPTKLQISNKITVAGWVNINAFKTPANLQSIIIKMYFDPSAGGNPRKGYLVSQDFYGGGVPALSDNIFSSSGGSVTSYIGQYVTSSSDPVTIHNWIFFALVIDGINTKFYKNGIKTNDVDGTVTLLDDGTLGDLNIGRYGGGSYLDGKVDDVTIHNKPLDAASILKLYNQTATKY